MSDQSSGLRAVGGELGAELVDAAIAIADSELKEHVLAALAKQQDRLHNYMAQARLSIARLYDTARENHLEKSFTETKEAAEAAKEQRAIEAAQNPAKSLSNTPVLEQVKSIDETPVEAGVEALPADEGVTP